MKRAALVAVLVASAAWAGTRFKVTGGAVPTASTDGVGLEGVVGCRASVKRTDGGDIAAGHIQYHYYDSAWATWIESSSDTNCDVYRLGDGGLRTHFVCPDFPVAARYGRIAISGEGVYSDDGGTSAFGHGNFRLADAGLLDAGRYTTPPAFRIECWGPAVFQ